MTGGSRPRRAGTAAAIAGITALGVVFVAPGTAGASPPEVTVSVAPTTVDSGGTVTVTETITNINGFSILDPTARLFSRPDAITGYTTLAGCTGGACATVTNGSGQPIGYQVVLDGALSGGASATVTFTLNVDADANSATETLQGQLFGLNYATNPVDGPALAVIGRADLGVALTAAPRLGLLVANIDFTVTVTDNGPASEPASTVTATVPSGLSVSSARCTPGGGGATCAFGPIASGASATARFTVPIGLDIGIPFTFGVARTASAEPDPNPANDSASVTCTVVTVLLVSCHSGK